MTNWCHMGHLPRIPPQCGSTLPCSLAVSAEGQGCCAPWGGSEAAQRKTLTGDGQVGGGLGLAGCVVGETLEHAGIVGQQAADLQAAIAALLEACELSHLHQRSVLVPGDGGRRHPCGRPGPRSAILPHPGSESAGGPRTPCFLERSHRHRFHGVCFFKSLKKFWDRDFWKLEIS